MSARRDARQGRRRNARPLALGAVALGALLALPANAGAADGERGKLKLHAPTLTCVGDRGLDLHQQRVIVGVDARLAAVRGSFRARRPGSIKLRHDGAIRDRDGRALARYETDTAKLPGHLPKGHRRQRLSAILSRAASRRILRAATGKSECTGRGFVGRKLRVTNHAVQRVRGRRPALPGDFHESGNATQTDSSTAAVVQIYVDNYKVVDLTFEVWNTTSTPFQVYYVNLVDGAWLEPLAPVEVGNNLDALTHNQDGSVTYGFFRFDVRNGAFTKGPAGGIRLAPSPSGSADQSLGDLVLGFDLDDEFDISEDDNGPQGHIDGTENDPSSSCLLAITGDPGAYCNNATSIENSVVGANRQLGMFTTVYLYEG